MKNCGHQNRDPRNGFCAVCLTEQKHEDAGIRMLDGFQIVANPAFDCGTFALVDRSVRVPGALVDLWSRELEGTLKAYTGTLERAFTELSTPLEKTMEMNRWKVVVMRNGVAEALTIESNVVRIVHDSGALLFENCRERTCELVRCFAAGTWLEYAPAGATPSGGDPT